MYQTYHGIEDRAKFDALVADMSVRGWVGAPIVADGDNLITGAHRYPAALEAGITPNVVDIRDIYPDWDAILEDYGCPVIDERDYVSALSDLPAALREEYGIDAH